MHARRWLLALAVTALGAAPAAAEVTRDLAGEIAASAPFAVENLAGSMRVVAGDGDQVQVSAPVHAESAEVASAVRLETVRSKHGVATLRVRYPLDRWSKLRYPGGDGGGAEANSPSFLERIFTGRSN